MAQVETPPLVLRDFADFQKLANAALSDAEVRRLLRHPDFFVSPKDTDPANRQHAQLVDRILTLDMKGIETRLVTDARAVLPQGSFEYWGPALHEGAQTWVGLDPQTLNSPYAVLKRMCDILRLREHQLVVDLGAAMGRLGMVMHQCAPRAHFLGLEYVPERVEEANRVYAKWGMRHARCEVQDLFARGFELPEADVYFIYDYGRHDHINATLRLIEAMSQKRPLKLVARGQATNRLIELHHTWPELIYQGHGAEHFNIYQAHGVSQ